MPPGKEGRKSKAIEWDGQHLEEECNARGCRGRHKSWGLRKQKQVFSVWWTTGTTRSDLKHPKTGKKRPLYRRLDLKNFSDPKAELGQLFANPRKHTGVGYYTKVRQLCGDVQC